MRSGLGVFLSIRKLLLKIDNLRPGPGESLCKEKISAARAHFWSILDMYMIWYDFDVFVVVAICTCASI